VQWSVVTALERVPGLHGSVLAGGGGGVETGAKASAMVGELADLHHMAGTPSQRCSDVEAVVMAGTTATERHYGPRSRQLGWPVTPHE
jgi:hypothetical protein